eukprot:6501899-Ditylum_brightwellii.AAC.1
MEGISSSKDTNKDIKEEAIKEEDADKMAVAAVGVIAVDKEKEPQHHQVLLDTQMLCPLG